MQKDLVCCEIWTSRTETTWTLAAQQVRAMKAGETAFKKWQQLHRERCSLDEIEQPIRVDFQPINSGFHLPGLWGLHSIISCDINLWIQVKEEGADVLWSSTSPTHIRTKVSLMIGYLNLLRCTWTWTWSVSADKTRTKKKSWCMYDEINEAFHMF